MHEAFGWRSVFLVLAALGVVLALTVHRFLAETRQHPPTTTRARPAYVATITARAFWAGAGPVVCTSAAVFAYLGASSFLLQETHGLTPGQYSIDFAVNAAGLMLGASLGRQTGRRLRPVTCLRIGVGISLAGGACLAVGLYQHTGLVPVLVGFFLITAGQGWTSPYGIASAMMPHPQRAGAVSALFGAFQYGAGAIVVLLTGSASNALAVVTVTVMAATITGIALSFIPIREHSARPVRKPTAVGAGQQASAADNHISTRSDTWRSARSSPPAPSTDCR